MPPVGAGGGSREVALRMPLVPHEAWRAALSDEYAVDTDEEFFAPWMRVVRAGRAALDKQTT